MNASIEAAASADDKLSKRLACFILTAGIVLLDQLTKFLVVAYMPIHKSIPVIGDFLRLTHVRNTAVAFSIGQTLPPIVKQILFLAVPIAVIGFIVYLIVRAKDVTGVQRWILAAICGGGLGNIIDRIFRPEGVVDFIDVDFFDINLFNLFRLNRWPVFNVADSTVVVGVVLLLIVLIVTKPKGTSHE